MRSPLEGRALNSTRVTLSRLTGAVLIGLLGIPLGSMIAYRLGYQWVLGAAPGFLTVTLLAAAVWSIVRDDTQQTPPVRTGRASYLKAVLVMATGPVLTLCAMLIAPIIAGAGGMHHEVTPWVAWLVFVFFGPPATAITIILGLAMAVRTFRQRRNTGRASRPCKSHRPPSRQHAICKYMPAHCCPA